MPTKLNSKGSANASKLVNAGKIDKGDSWSAPSADAENKVINQEGWNFYASFFLGVNSEAKPETKERYSYPFSSDFKNISLSGLKAIRQRAGQQHIQSIFNKAGVLIDKIEKKETKAQYGDIIWIGD